ncbi:hypothetical protein SAMN05518849_11848 [Sphingobium sp. AP50]|uniref:hypothetical protein n=1 Tax=Sphingobium sp. AP50 TaxID=1884369 RepID=UPI0008D5D176|nr:hypothetical protein [Sphingobium sp. AP50]SEJ91895.1 hypothetical protein SAMN05518849_11848 [Sphingobium sp. AP50]
MVAAPAIGKRAASGSGRRGIGRALYASKALTVSTHASVRVHVDLSIGSDPAALQALHDALAASVAQAGVSGKTITDAASMLAMTFEKVAERYLSDAFSGEFDKMVSEYRVMLRENLVKGDDLQLKAALNRARLQERILTTTQMADQAEACELLGLSGANPSATMKRKEDRQELLRFTVDGRAVYPLLQFDVEGRRVYPAMRHIIRAKPDEWSDFRLLHWLTRPHLDFDDTPGAALAGEPEAVIAAFEREAEPEVHG